MSISEKKLMETPEYKDYGFKIVECPICGELTLDNNYICSNCGWEYDNAPLNEDYYSNANKSTIKDFRTDFLSKQ